MTEDDYGPVDHLIETLLVHQDDALTRALADNAAAGMRPVDVAPSHGKLLNLLIRMCGARKILEIGTLGGYSTIWMARALPADGRVITLESEHAHADVARRNLDRAGIGNRVEIRTGKALDTLPGLAEDGSAPFDLVFIDADKGNNTGYLDWAVRLTRPGSVIIADNVVRSGRIIDPEPGNIDVAGSRAILEAMGEHPALDATAIQTVGVKGWDGFAIALVTDSR